MYKAPVVKLPKNIILIQINLLLKEKWLKSYWRAQFPHNQRLINSKPQMK